jgi:hypothetical protein
MTFIPFHQRRNKLYISDQQVRECPQLLDFFAYHNQRRPGTFEHDRTLDLWWFYPPEDYVMPTIEPQLKVAAHK